MLTPIRTITNLVLKERNPVLIVPDGSGARGEAGRVEQQQGAK
jgi:hypothetical protein